MKNYELTDAEIATLSPETQKIYKEAIWFCHQESAGGPGGGWARGYELLKSLGWTEETTQIDHINYTRLRKPELGRM